MNAVAAATAMYIVYEYEVAKNSTVVRFEKQQVQTDPTCTERTHVSDQQLVDFVLAARAGCAQNEDRRRPRL